MYGDKFKTLYFNELTISSACSDETKTYQSINLYGKTFGAVKSKLGTVNFMCARSLRDVILYDGVTFKDFCDRHRNDNAITLALSLFGRAIHSDDPDLTASDTSVTLSATGKMALGLTAAYKRDVPSLGFYSNDGMETPMVGIAVSSSGVICELKWPCLTKPSHLEDTEFGRWLQDHTDVELVETKIVVKDKKIGLPEHHGRNKLYEHAKSLIKNKYVEGILCSLEWKDNFKKYI